MKYQIQFKLSGGAVSCGSSFKESAYSNSFYNKAKYVVSTACACQIIWMKRVFNHFNPSQSKCITVFCDNLSFIKLSKNPILHGRRKHIDVRFHFLCNLIRDGVVKLNYCGRATCKHYDQASEAGEFCEASRADEVSG